MRDDLVSIVVQSRFGVSIGALSIVMFIVYYLARYCTLWNIHSYAAGYCILFQYCTTVPPVCSQTTRHQNCCCYYKFSAFTKNHKTQHLTRTSSMIQYCIHSRLKIGRCQKNGNGKNDKNDKNDKNGKTGKNGKNCANDSRQPQIKRARGRQQSNFTIGITIVTTNNPPPILQ